MVEVGNPERDILLFDIGSGSLANYASLKLPVNQLNKVFLSHLHADHMGDLITLSGSWSKVGRADGPIYVWGPSGTEPRLGTKHFVEGIEEALAWDTAAGGGAINPESLKIVVSEFDFSQTQVVYEQNGVKVTSFPSSTRRAAPSATASTSPACRSASRVHARLLAARAGLQRRRPAHPRVLSARRSARRRFGLSIERATIALNAAHTSPTAAGKVFNLAKPRVAGLYHTLLSPQVIQMVFAELGSVYAGPVVQTQDLTVFNVTQEAVVVAPGKTVRPVAADAGQAAYGLPAGRGAASRLVGGGAHPARLSPGV